MNHKIEETNYEIFPSYVDTFGDQRVFQLEMAKFIKGEKKAAVLSAPTGSGKTHGFRLMGQKGNTILIVFPNNLLSNEVFRTFRDLNIDDISLLNASTINSLIREKKNTGFYDFTQRKAIGKLLENKKFIITNPTVYYNLLNNHYNAGSRMDMLSELMKNNLSCIIFDEFHIYSRDQVSMLLASTLLLRNEVKIMFSSATIQDYLEGLLKELYGEENVCEITAKRSLENNGNSSLLQGKVNVHIVRSSAISFIQNCKEVFKTGKWFIILDSIRNIHEAYHALLDDFPSSEITMISAYHDPSYEDYIKLRDGMSDKRIVIGSNIIEQGINPPSDFNNFLIEPGYSTESFIQRSGRIGRGSFKPSELYVTIESETNAFPEKAITFDDLFRVFNGFKYRYLPHPNIESLGTYLWFIIDRLTKNAKEAVFENLKLRKVNSKLLAACFRAKKLDVTLKTQSWLSHNIRYVKEIKQISNWWIEYRESVYDFIPPQNEVDVLDTSEDFIEYGGGFATQYSEIWIRKNKKIVNIEDGIIKVEDFLTKPDYDFEVYVKGLPFSSKVKMKYGEIYFKSRKEIITRFEEFNKKYFDLPDDVKDVLESLKQVIYATAGPERLRLELA